MVEFTKQSQDIARQALSGGAADPATVFEALGPLFDAKDHNGTFIVLEAFLHAKTCLTKLSDWARAKVDQTERDAEADRVSEILFWFKNLCQPNGDTPRLITMDEADAAHVSARAWLADETGDDSLRVDPKSKGRRRHKPRNVDKKDILEELAKLDITNQ